MRIERLHIDSFGSISDFRLDLKPGVTLLAGDNETGKTTLLECCRWILFGKLVKESIGGKKEVLRKPVTGGGLSARMMVRMADGALLDLIRTEEQNGFRVTDEAGSDATARFLRMLSFCDAETYEKVFAFGLDELSHLEGQVSRMLFSAMAGLGGANIEECRKVLTSAADEIFSERGRKGSRRFQQILGELGDIRDRLRTIAQAKQEYDDLIGDRETLESEQKANREDAQTKSRGLHRMQGDLEAIPTCRQYREALRELECLPIIEGFAVNSLDEFERLQSEEGGLSAKILSYEEALRRLAPDLVIRPLAAEIDDIIKRNHLAEQQDQRLQDIEDKLSRLPSSDPDQADADVAAINEKRTLLRELRTNIHQRDTTQADRTRAEDKLELVNQARGKPWPIFVGVALVAAMGILFLLLGQMMNAAVMLAIGVVAAGLGAVLRAGGSAVSVAEAHSDLVRKAAEADRIREEVNMIAARLGIAPDPTILDADRFGDELEDLARVSEEAERQKRERKELVEEQNRLHRAIEGFSSDLRSLAERMDVPIPKDRNAALLEFRNRLQSYHEAVEPAAKFAADIGATKDQLQNCLQRIGEILSQAGAKDVDQLRQLDEQQRKRKEIEDKAKAFWNQIIGHLMHPDDAAIESLAGTDEFVLGSHCEELRRDIDNLQNRHDAIQGELGEIRRRIADIEQMGSLAEVRSKEQDALDRLRGAGLEWAAIVLALDLLDETRKTYEQEKQPAVLRHAGRIFQQITDGRYTHVLAPIDQNTIRVRGADDRWWEPTALSRGTREQLFLAIRFAYLVELAATQEALPVIMDDILVNFDDHRAAQCVDAVSEISQSHQILLMACRKETVEMFRTAMGTNVITLPPVTGNLPGEALVGRPALEPVPGDPAKLSL